MITTEVFAHLSSSNFEFYGRHKWQDPASGFDNPCLALLCARFSAVENFRKEGDLACSRPPLGHAPTLNYGSTFQNAVFAIALAFLLSADVPGVNWPLSPAELNEAACC